jgi:hypothetical protein
MSTPTTAPVLFSITGYSCSGLDWLGRLLALHPQILIVHGTPALSRHGTGDLPHPNERRRTGAAAVAQAQAMAAARPGITHVGIVGVDGAILDLPGQEIVVLRDGRDVVVQWTLRQLREQGPALLGVLANCAPDRPLCALRDLHRRDPATLHTTHRALLLADYEWTRFATHLWDRVVDGHCFGLAEIQDGRSSADWPTEVFFEVARAAPRLCFDTLVRRLGLDPAAAPPFGCHDPVQATASDEERMEWEVGAWSRWFTPRQSGWFEMDGRQGLAYTTGIQTEPWAGDCPPLPA